METEIQLFSKFVHFITKGGEARRGECRKGNKTRNEKLSNETNENRIGIQPKTVKDGEGDGEWEWKRERQWESLRSPLDVFLVQLMENVNKIPLQNILQLQRTAPFAHKTPNFHFNSLRIRNLTATSSRLHWSLNI